jgi:hypothetical protein
VTGVGSAHHVLGVEALLGELGHGEGAVLLGATGSEGGETDHEEVKTGEGDEVHGELAEVGVELTGEAEAACDTRHSCGHEVVEVTVGGGGELEGTEADVVKGFVVEAEALVSVLNELVHGEGGIVGLYDGVRHLGGRAHGEGGHDSVGVFLTDLGDEESTHAGTSTTTKRVSDLETLEAIAGFRFLADYVKHGVDELSTFSVVALGPIVTSTSLAEHKVVGAEELTEGPSTDRIHGTGLKVHEDGTGHVAATGGFVKVDVDALQLKVGVTVVGTGGVNTVLVGDYLPELGTDLVTALAALDVYEFTHDVER